MGKLFEILTKSSPTSLFKFKFKFHSIGTPKLESFFDNWKGKHPMLIQIISDRNIDLELIERYKVEGIVKKYDYDYNMWRGRGGTFENFEWM